MCAMPDRKYKIHGEAGTAWLLVFEGSSGRWFVDEVRTDHSGRRRFSLELFEQSAMGQHLSRRIKLAVENAALER